jgi:hypothetical protein
MDSSLRWHSLLLALSLVAAAPAAHALSVSGIAIAPTGANTASLLNNAGANRAQVSSSAALVGAAPGPVADEVGASVSFDARYAQLVAANREAGGGSFVQSATASWSITFTIDNPIGGLYRLDVDTTRLGALTLVNDGGGNASAALGAVTGLLDGVPDPALALPAVPTLSGAAGGNAGFSQTGTTLTLFDSAPSRTFTLTFGWTATATSARDEAAIRLGLPGALTATSADDYPGAGGRVAANDGHFVRVGVTLLAVPEPGALTLVLGGLVALAAERRRAGAAPRA